MAASASIFARLDDEAAAAAAALDVADGALLERIEAARALHEESLGEYVTGAVRRFARLAGDEEYVTFRTRLERAADPERAAVSAILAWSVRRDLAGAEGEGVRLPPADRDSASEGGDHGRR